MSATTALDNLANVILLNLNRDSSSEKMAFTQPIVVWNLIYMPIYVVYVFLLLDKGVF